jgi:transposase InsO family protein
VIDEVIKIKALMPTTSCRIISLIFNERHQSKETIGKTFVDYTLRNHQYEIQRERRKIKSKPAYQIPFNKVWGMDITFVQENPILGIIEHHSRKSLTLIPLKQKTSIAILRRLLDILETTPKPQYIRTDNEICFNSKLIMFGLWVLGIKKQTTQKHCPWQNGRIERYFGTLKATLKNLPKQETSDLPYLMYSFEFWYNQIRMHQNLDNQTPESVYQKQIRKWTKENPPDG